MSDVEKSPGTRAMETFEGERDARLAQLHGMLAPAIDELRAADGLLPRLALLASWALHYPAAIVHLFDIIGRDRALAEELAPSLLAVSYQLDSTLLPAIDDALIAAFPTLAGAYREAAAERPAIRAAFGLIEGTDYHAIPALDPAWKLGAGAPYPPATEVAGIQARLNYLGYAAGPITGAWSEVTRRALARWQLHQGIDPTGETDADTIDKLDWETPDRASQP